MSRVNRSTPTTAAQALVCALSLTPAFADGTDRQQMIDQAFRSLDASGDGALDAAEAAASPSLADALAPLAPSGSLGKEGFAIRHKAYDQQPAEEQRAARRNDSR